MTKNEKLNTAVYTKLQNELNEYEQFLLSLSPKEILDNHAYEYTIKSDIVLALEYNNLTDDQCEALLKMPDPLQTAFNLFEKIESDHMEIIFDTVGNCADSFTDQKYHQELREISQISNSLKGES